MYELSEVPVGNLTPTRFKEVLAAEAGEEFVAEAERARQRFAGRVVWNISSTAHGGGVAEMLRSLLAYGRGAGVDVRWLTIGGDEAFFRITKRLHNRLHGMVGDGGDLGPEELEHFERVGGSAAESALGRMAPGDVVIVHDPQPSALCGPLVDAGMKVIWRCHIGTDDPNDLSAEAGRFLLPFVTRAHATVFSRRSFVWEGIDAAEVEVIPPSIDAFSAKNQELSEAAVGAILSVAGIVLDGAHTDACFVREDGTPGRVDRVADLRGTGPVPDGAPIVTQVSRWDRLKDPVGVVRGFAEHVPAETNAHLVYAGPEVAAVSDDPEGAEVLAEIEEFWRSLPPEDQARVHLVCLPMADDEENAAMVNALQRRSTVVVQKSLAEGFGLTVSEAMWKSRPVVASAVGGIQDQIVDGVSGLLLDDPADLAGYGRAVTDLLADPDRAGRMGAAARERVVDRFMASRQLLQYVALLDRLIG
jgi:trehalose synthase